MNRNLKAAILSLVLVAPFLMSQGANAESIEERIRRTIDPFLRPSTPTNPTSPTTPGLPTSQPNRGVTNSDGAITRAMNLARQAAERANGGLSVYRAESAMYGPSERAPYVVNRDKTITFTFLGGKPAEPPSIQSVVTVSDGGERVNVDYNGPIRAAN
jgi:hypothetical protein